MEGNGYVERVAAILVLRKWCGGALQFAQVSKGHGGDRCRVAPQEAKKNKAAEASWAKEKKTVGAWG